MGRNTCKSQCRLSNGFSVISRTRGYSLGFKYCTICEKSKKTLDIRCLCCTTKYRTTPKNKKHSVLQVVQ